LKEENRHVEVIATATSFTRALRRARKKGEISRVRVGLSESVVPKKPQRAIFSVLGTMNYTFSSIHKEHLLKLANCLAPRGLLFAHFEFNPVNNLTGSKTTIRHGLSNDAQPRDRLTLATEILGIEKAFKKRGFNACFFWVKNDRSTQLDRYSLIVQRTDKPFRRDNRPQHGPLHGPLS
jgi:hypothetical protein